LLPRRADGDHDFCQRCWPSIIVQTDRQCRDAFAPLSLQRPIQIIFRRGHLRREQPASVRLQLGALVPHHDIDQRFLDTPYYVSPNEAAGHEAFAVIREALRHKAMVALGRLVLAKGEGKCSGSLRKKLS
jgi:hypothetical protein